MTRPVTVAAEARKDRMARRRGGSKDGPRWVTRGPDGIRAALAGLEHPTAAATAVAILRAVTECWREPLEDDGTVAVLAVT